MPQGANRVPPKQFNGWAHVRASVLEKGWFRQWFPVIASPIDLDGIEGNTHHAHIVIECNVTSAALYLREIFASRGEVEKIEPPKAREGASVWRMVVNLVNSRWRTLVFKAKNRR
jgi:hypothetical protein